MVDLLDVTRVAFRKLADLSCESMPEAAGADLFGLARRHRVVGLLSATYVPAWRVPMQGQLVHMARCADEALQVMEALRAIDPTAFLLKGPVLALQGWAQPALRQYDDVDLRCRKIPYRELAGVLEACGYRAEHADARRMARLWEFGWGVGFKKAPGLIVECNWRWFPPQYPGLERCLPTKNAAALLVLDGVSVQGAAPVAHLLHGCMHLVWHNWARLGWLVDVAGLLVRYPDVLTQARTMAGAQGFVRDVLETVCGIAHDLLGPLPGTFRDVSASRRATIVARLEAVSPPSSLALERAEHLQYMQGYERWGYQLRRMMIPGDPDFVRWRLPARLRWMYWGLRPVRILGEILKS